MATGRVLATVLVICAALVFAASCSVQHFAPTPLREISAVKKLAGRQAPTETMSVTVRGVVTFAADHVLFIQDRTGGIKIDASGISSLPRVNTLLEVHGLLLRSPGLPVLVRPSLIVLGLAESPLALPALASDLPTAGFAGRLVEVSGLSQSAGIDLNGLLRVRVRNENQIITGHLTDKTHAERDDLPGALITLRGVADPVVNTEGKVEEYRLWSDSGESLKILKPGIPRWSVPVSSVGQLRASFTATTSRPNPRTRLHGQVLDDGRGGLTFQDATGTLPMKMGQSLISFTGRNLWVWAFPRISQAGLLLEDADMEQGEQSAGSVSEDRNLIIRRVVDVRSMDPRDAAKGTPVRLDATVTYALPVEGLLFIQDETSGIYVDPSGPVPSGITAGWRVRVEGNTSGGAFAPSIYRARLTHIGEARLPRPVSVASEGLLSARMDSQWIQVEGIARSIEQTKSSLILHLVNGPTRFTANVSGTRKLPEDLLGARLRLTGACGSSFNSRRQFNGVDIYLQSPAQLQIVRPRTAPFELPVTSVTSLLDFSPADQPGAQVRLRGVITMTTHSGSVFIRDSSGGLELCRPRPSH